MDIPKGPWGISAINFFRWSQYQISALKYLKYFGCIPSASTLVYRLKKSSSQIINQILHQLPPKVSDAQLSNPDIIFMILVASIKIWLQTASRPEHRVHFAIFFSSYLCVAFWSSCITIGGGWLISSFLLWENISQWQRWVSSLSSMINTSMVHYSPDLIKQMLWKQSQCCARNKVLTLSQFSLWN